MTYDEAYVEKLQARLKAFECEDPEIAPHPEIEDAVIISTYHVSVIVRPAAEGDVPTTGWVVEEFGHWPMGVMPELTEEKGQLLIFASRYAKEREEEDENAEEEARKALLPPVDCTDQLTIQGAPL